MGPDKSQVQAGRSPAQSGPYLLAWLSTSRCWSGFLGLPCCSGLLGSAGLWVGAAGSPWSSCWAPGLPCQASPTLVTTFSSSKSAKVLRENKPLVTDYTPISPPVAIAGSSPRRWGRQEPGMAPTSGRARVFLRGTPAPLLPSHQQWLSSRVLHEA